jgi:hypothetical protein
MEQTGKYCDANRVILKMLLFFPVTGNIQQ